MPMLQAGTRKLDYDFFTEPNPIRASAPGANPNTIDLRVTVSNPSRSIVTMAKIEISIPLGQEVSRDLSSSPGLPSAVYDTSGPWTITTHGGTVTIVPRDGRDQSPVTAPILFRVPGLVVNQTPGTVPLTITEFPPPPDSKAVDASTYFLTKRPADFPISSLSVEPAVLNDLDQYVTIFWTCTPHGQSYVYGLQAEVAAAVANDERVESSAQGQARAVPIPLHDCISDDVCYQCTNGTDGVRYGPVNDTTTIVLNVVEPAGATGTKKIVASLRATVRLLLPTISQNSFHRSSPSGRFVWLHWFARNARSCSVQMDGVAIEDNAPSDTYEHGFMVTLNDDKPTHQFALVAHAETGDAVANFAYPVIATGSPRTVHTRPRPRLVALSTYMSVAVVGHEAEPSVSIVYLPDAQVIATIAVGRGARGIAFRPEDGAKAIVAAEDGSLTSIDLHSNSSYVDLPSLPAASGACITLDGSTLLVTDPTTGQSALVLIDLAKKVITDRVKIEMPGQSANALALSPDGTIAVVTTTNPKTHQGKFIVVDVPTRQIKQTFDVDGDPADVAITSNGQSAFVANPHTNLLLTFDIQAPRFAFFVSTDAQPRAVAAMPDGVHTLAASVGTAGATLSCFAGRGQARVTFPIPDVRTPASVAVAPDGQTVVVADIDRDCIVIL